jgi:hypothetical protein
MVKVGLLGLVIAASAMVSVPAAAQTARANPIPSGFAVERGGDLVHKMTGTRFPASAEGFTRIASMALDATGKYPLVIYERGTGPDRAIARIAMVQIDDMSALEHFAAMAPTVSNEFRDLRLTQVKPLESGPLTLPGVAPRNAWQGHFSARRGGQRYMLSLSTLDMGHWAGRVTAAYPAAEAADIQKRLYALVAKIRATGPGHVHAGK